MKIDPRVALLAAGLATFAACSSRSDGDAKGATPGAQVPAAAVTVGSVVQKDVPLQVRAIGWVEPYSTVSLRSQVDGQLARVHFQEGQEVKKGDLLFTVDPRPFEAALRKAEAQLAKDRAEAKNAEVEAKRREHLLAKGFISQDDYDRYRTEALSLRSTVKADQAAVDNARLSLQYCTIHSPIDGRIGRLLVYEGNVVKNNDTVLAVINQLRPIYVTFSTPEKQLAEIRRRSAAGKLEMQASPKASPGEPASGELRFINNTVDTSSGTVLLKGLFANADETLWPGQFVDVSLTLTIERNAVVTPAAAVQTGQQGTYVFVVANDRKAKIRPVVLGDTIGGETLVTRGLQAGETVVTDGQSQLADGTPVEIKNASGPEAQQTSVH